MILISELGYDTEAKSGS